jgi:SAM-dependent methyltransferase
VFTDGDDDHIFDGLLICDRCNSWYPIADYVLELVPPTLLYKRDLVEFEARFASELKRLALIPHSTDLALACGAPTYADQFKQREHFDTYAEGLKPGFVDYPHSPFWRAAANRFLAHWRRAMQRPGAWILDIGCGIGVNSLPLADHFTIIGFDISKGAVVKVTEDARRQNLMRKTTFFVGDGSFLPFRSETFDYAQTIGALHHLPNPQQALHEIQEILTVGGIYYGVENNKSFFRGIFDLLMRIKPLWIEEAGAEPLISAEMIADWLSGSRVQVNSETSVFLPPHLFNLLGPRLARSLLDMSDRFCARIPWLRNQGGQILFMVEKLAPPARHCSIRTFTQRP